MKDYKVVKAIVKAVWPIVYKQLEKVTDKTTSQWDDIALESISYAILAWIESDDEEE